MPTSKESKTHVKAAGDAIKRYWLIGRQIHDEGKTIEAMQDEHQLDYEIVRAAKQFATVYTEQEYLRLLQQIAAHKADSFGFGHLRLLVGIDSKRLRAKIQKECLKEHWPRKDLQAAIIAARGRVKKGGRRRKVDVEGGSLLAKVDQDANSWLA